MRLMTTSNRGREENEVKKQKEKKKERTQKAQWREKKYSNSQVELLEPGAVAGLSGKQAIEAAHCHSRLHLTVCAETVARMDVVTL